jgi:hypothetical protein
MHDFQGIYCSLQLQATLFSNETIHAQVFFFKLGKIKKTEYVSSE